MYPFTKQNLPLLQKKVLGKHFTAEPVDLCPRSKQNLLIKI